MEQPNAHEAEPEPTRKRPETERRRWPWAAMGAGLLVLLLVVPGPFAAAAPSGARGPTTDGAQAGPSESWAWGALANFSATIQYAGAYNNSQNLTGGNLTSSGAYVALDESVGLRYAAFVIVNASTPSNGTRYVEVQAAELRALHLGIAASGTFPNPGNYTPNASIPLAPRNFSLDGSVAVLQVANAFLNFSTGPNGSLALADEHVAFAEGVNLSLAAVRFPNVTRDAAGDLGIRYVTASVAANAWLYENLTATFAPALTLVDGPLLVGKTWNANSTVAFRGGEAWAETVHYVGANGGTAAAATSGSASANATVPVALVCTVTGTTVVRFPDGSVETDDLIACANATGSDAYLASNGLVVLPTSDPSHSAGLAAAVPERPATAPVATAAQAKGAAVYSPSHRLEATERATPSSGNTVTASPLTPTAARSGMRALGTPVRPAALPWEPSAALLVATMVATGIGTVGGVLLLARRARRHP